MTFMITFVAYMLRANISINILAMVRKNESDADVSVKVRLHETNICYEY